MTKSRILQALIDRLDSAISPARPAAATDNNKSKPFIPQYLILLAPFGILGVITYFIVLLQSPLSPFHKKPAEQIVNSRAEMDKLLREQESKAEQRKLLSERLEVDAAKDEYRNLINEISSLSYEVDLLNSGIASEFIKQAGTSQGTNQSSTTQQQSISQQSAPSSSSSSGPAQRQNALRKASSYLQTSGFSRNGLISQLTSSFEKFSAADATYAVDSLNANWNEQAARKAKSYLQTSGFSCNGLIDQLTSSSEQFTFEQARYGARASGACN